MGILRRNRIQMAGASKTQQSVSRISEGYPAKTGTKADRTKDEEKSEQSSSRVLDFSKSVIKNRLPKIEPRQSMNIKDFVRRILTFNKIGAENDCIFWRKFVQEALNIEQ
jgi:hypothetical protein